MDCTFEYDVCQWTQDQPGAVTWNRVQASDKVYNSAPISDVTTGTGMGTLTFCRLQLSNNYLYTISNFAAISLSSVMA